MDLVVHVNAYNNRFEADGLPFRSTPGQAAAQAERSAEENGA